MTEERSELLKSLLSSGVIAEDKRAGIDSLVMKLEEKMVKYGKEKKEVLEGSEHVGKESRVQDVEREFGVIKGAKKLETEAKNLRMPARLF